jgi:hypothetical protein
MHMDHVGGLLVDGVKDRLRPDVRIHVSATEVEFWTSPDFSYTDMPKPVPGVLRSTARSFYNARGLLGVVLETVVPVRMIGVAYSEFPFHPLTMEVIK